jgi:hypothetical protein
MKFEEALQQPGELVQAWDVTVKDGQRAVSIYRVGSEGAKQLAYLNVPEGGRAVFATELQGRGVQKGETDFNCDFVWVPVENGLVVYDSKRKVLEARGDQLTLADGRVIARADFANVITYATENYVERGVRGELKSGEKVDLVVEQALGPMGDPTYSRNELLWETEWCSSIASALGAWAGTGFDNQI